MNGGEKLIVYYFTCLDCYLGEGSSARGRSTGKSQLLVDQPATGSSAMLIQLCVETLVLSLL